MAALATTRYWGAVGDIGLVDIGRASGYFRKLSYRFRVVRVMFGIPKRVTLLVFGSCRKYFRYF